MMDRGYGSISMVTAIFSMRMRSLFWTTRGMEHWIFLNAQLRGGGILSF